MRGGVVDVFVCLLIVGPSLQTSSESWQELDYASSITFTPRHSFSASYFVGSQEVMIFGGRAGKDVVTGISPILGDAWLFSVVSSRHTLVPPGIFSPPARYGHTGIARKDSLVIFGGEGLNIGKLVVLSDVWLFSQATSEWQDVTPQVSAAAAPRPRKYHVASYLPEWDIMIICGGVDLTGEIVRDAWYLDLSSASPAGYRWVQILSEGRDDSPCGRYKHSGNSYKGSFVVYGGMDDERTLLGDLWRLSIRNTTTTTTTTGATATMGAQVSRLTFEWKQLFSSSSPATPRAAHAAVVIGNRLIIHGGLEAAGFGDLKAQRDTWFFDFNTFKWKLVPVDGDTHVASHHVGVSDTHYFWLLGGLTVSLNEPINSVFRLRSQLLERILPAGPSPSGRFGHVGVVDAQGAHFYVYGGQNATATLSDFWVLDLDARLWSLLDPSPALVPPRSLHTAASDECFTYIFGGKDDKNTTTSTLFVVALPSLPSFKLINPLSPTPPARQAHSAKFVGDDLVVFGGQGGDGTALGDTWVFTPTNTPPANTRPAGLFMRVADDEDAPKSGDGVDRMAVFGRASFLQATAGSTVITELSVEFWVQICAIEKANTLLFEMVIGCGKVGVHIIHGVFRVMPCLPGPMPRATVTPPLANDGKWHHIAASFPHSPLGLVGPSLWVDGELVSEPYASYEQVLTTPLGYTARPFEWHLCHDDITASVDSLRLWSTQLNAQNISDLMYSSFLGSDDWRSKGLIAAYPFDFNSRTTTYDVSGYGRHALFGNGIIFDSPSLKPSLAPINASWPTSATAFVSGSWSQLKLLPKAAAPPPRHSHAATSTGRTSIVVFGGYDSEGTLLNDVWMLSVPSSTWSQLRTGGSLISGFGGFVAFDREQSILLLGAAAEHQARMSLASYAVSSQQLSSFAPIDQVPPLSGMSLTPLPGDEDALVFGGHLQQVFFSDALFVLSAVTRKMTLFPILQSPIPLPVFWSRMVAIGGDRFVLYGGWGVADTVHDTWIYDVNERRWELVVPARGSEAMPRRDAHGAVSWRNRLLVFAGEDENVVHYNTMWLFDPRTMLWSQLNTTNNPPPRAYISTDISSDRLYVYGGYMDYTFVRDDFWFCNMDTLDWTQIPKAGTWPGPLYGASTHIHRNNLFLLCGQSDDLHASTRTNNVWMYALGSGTWRLVRPARDEAVPVGRRDANTALLGDVVFMHGGMSASAEFGYAGDLSDLWAFHCTKLRWQHLTPLGENRAPALSGSSLFATGGYAYLFGGAVGLPPAFRYSNEMWRFNVGSAYPKYCVVTGFRPQLVAKETMTLHIQAYDIFQQLKTTSGDLFKMQIKGPIQFETEVVDLGEGKYVSNFEVENVGDYVVEVKLSGELLPLKRNEFVVHPGKGSAEDSEAAGPGLTAAVAGDWASFVVHARDIASNPLLSNGEVGVLIGTQPAQIIQDKRDGSFNIRYLLTTAGTFSTTITLNDEEINGSPFATVISAGKTDPSKTLVWGRGTSSTQAGTSGIVFVQTVDVFGNNKTGTGEDTVTASFPADDAAAARGVQRNITIQPVVAESEGRYRLSYLPFAAGTMEMVVSVNGMAVGTPYTIAIASVFNVREDGDILTLMVIGFPVATFCLGALCFFLKEWINRRSQALLARLVQAGEAKRNSQHELLEKRTRCVKFLLAKGQITQQEHDVLVKVKEKKMLDVVDAWDESSGEDTTGALGLLAFL